MGVIGCTRFHFRLRELDHRGHQTDASMLTARGFMPGQEVCRKADGTSAKILELMPQKVLLEVCDSKGGSTVSVSAESFMLGEWRAMKSRMEAAAFEGWGKSLPPTNMEFLAAQWRSEVLKRVMEMESQHPVTEDAMSIFLKPHRDVQTRVKHAAGQLVIAPLSHKFDIRPELDAPASPGALCVGVAELLGLNFKVWILPCHSAPSKSGADATVDRPLFVHPFWNVKAGAVLEETNMDIVPKGHAQRRIKLDGSWKIPVAKNRVVLNIGDSLVLFRPSPPKPVPEALVPEPRAKKMKAA